MSLGRILRSMLLATLASGIIVTTAGAVTTTLTMDTDPVDEGWRLINNGGSHSVSDGILKIDAPSYYEFLAPDSIWRYAVDNDRGWAIETRMRRDPASGTPPEMWIQDTKHYSHPQFLSDGMRFTSNSAFQGFAALDTSVFHTYLFESRGDRLDVTIDGKLVLILDDPRSSGASFVFFFGNGKSEWDYVSVTTNGFPVPIPATIWLMGIALAGLAAAARPRKGQ